MQVIISFSITFMYSGNNETKKECVKMSTLGEVIQKSRKEKRLTTTELANKIDLTQGYISHIENNRKNPSLDIIRKLSNALDIDFYELAYLAGHITDAEIEDARYQRSFFDSMTPEEEREYEENQLKWQIKYSNITQYQEKIHVRLEDFLNNNRRSFYIDDHKLSNEDIKMLITLYGGKEKDYPSDEQIEEEYEEVKRTKEENEKQIASGEAFFIMNYDDDINTDEDI